MRCVFVVGALASLLLSCTGWTADFGRKPAGYFRYSDFSLTGFQSYFRNPLSPEHALQADLARSADERAVMNAMVFKVLDNIPNPYPKIIFDDRRADGLAGIHVALQYRIIFQ
jgi:hypothetical protein